MSRDVTWLNTYYGEFYKTNQRDLHVVSIDRRFYEKYFENDEKEQGLDETNGAISDLDNEGKEMRMGRTRSRTMKFDVPVVGMTFFYRPFTCH